MAGLEIALERSGGTVLVRLKGTVDTSTVEDLDRSLATLSSGGQKTVVVDMGNVDYVNSRGMALLIKYNDVFAQSRRRFAVCSLNNRIKPTFELMGLTEALEIVDQPEAVLAPKSPEKPAPETPAEHGINCPACKAAIVVSALGYFRCSRCGRVFRVSKGWKARAVGGKKADRVTVIIPALAKYVSAVRAGIESLAAEYLHDPKRLWPATDEVLGLLVEKAARHRRADLRLAVELMADDDRFIVVFVLPPNVEVSDAEVKEHEAFKMAAKAFSKIEVSRLAPEGQVLRLEK